MAVDRFAPGHLGELTQHLPFEIVEIFRRQTWFRFSLLAVNLLVFVYLLQLLLMRARERAAVNQEAAS